MTNNTIMAIGTLIICLVTLGTVAPYLVSQPDTILTILGILTGLLAVGGLVLSSSILGKSIMDYIERNG